MTCTYSGEDEHTHIHILMQTLMYVEVSNIMVCNQHAPDPNKHEKTLDVVCVCVCVCGVCVTCTYSGVDMHPSMCCVCVYVYVVCA